LWASRSGHRAKVDRTGQGASDTIAGATVLRVVPGRSAGILVGLALPRPRQKP